MDKEKKDTCQSLALVSSSLGLQDTINNVILREQERHRGHEACSRGDHSECRGVSYYGECVTGSVRGHERTGDWPLQEQ